MSTGRKKDEGAATSHAALFGGRAESLEAPKADMDPKVLIPTILMSIAQNMTAIQTEAKKSGLDYSRVFPKVLDILIDIKNNIHPKLTEDNVRLLNEFADIYSRAKPRDHRNENLIELINKTPEAQLKSSHRPGGDKKD